MGRRDGPIELVSELLAGDEQPLMIKKMDDLPIYDLYRSKIDHRFLFDHIDAKIPIRTL